MKGEEGALSRSESSERGEVSEPRARGDGSGRVGAFVDHVVMLFIDEGFHGAIHQFGVFAEHVLSFSWLV